VILNAQDAARFQHAEARPEPRIERPPVLHHVDLAHHENQIDLSVEVQFRRRVVDPDHLNLPVELRRRAK